ncbi:hypothetical protein, partial [Bacteroides heparinolyticus]|uniref:hypothetical protein n=1 Tax=Prevotella heparinolytica TaxID=28113 RepID=UPI00359F3092
MPAYNFLPAMRKKNLPPPPDNVKIIHQNITLRNHSVDVEHMLDVYINKHFGIHTYYPLFYK